MVPRRSIFPYLVRALLLVALLALAACGSAARQVVEEVMDMAAATLTAEAEQPQATAAPAEAEATAAIDESAAAVSTEAPADAPTAVAPTEAAAPAEAVEAVVISAQGFGQDNTTVGYAFVVSNPNTATGFENIAYQVAALDTAGTVVATDSGYINVLFAGETQGVGGSLFVDSGATVNSLTVQVSGGDAVAGDPVAGFTVEGGQYIPGDFGNQATGIVVSPFGRAFDDLRVSAVAYDAAGAIVGGGFTFVNFVPANGRTGVTVQVTAAGEVAEVALYPALSALSFLDSGDELPADGQALELLGQGVGSSEFGSGFGILVRNPNTGYALENSRYRITGFDAAGNVVATDEGYIEVLLPGQTLGIGGSLFAAGDSPIATTEALVKAGDFIASDSTAIFTTENVAYVPGDFSSEVTGTILNPHNAEVSDLRVSAVAYDAADQIIGGGFTFLDFVPAAGSAAASVPVTTNGEPARVELYAALSALSQVGD